jgi:hypothetical protein
LHLKLTMCKTPLSQQDSKVSAPANHMLPCVVVVDPLSTGGTLAAELAQRGYAVIAAWSHEVSEEMRSHVPELARNLKYHAEIEELPTVAATAKAVTAAVGCDHELLACIVGCETGVKLADALSQELGLRTNGTEINRQA